MFRKDGMGIGIRLIKLPNDQKNNTERISTGQNNHRKVKMNRNSVSMLSYKNFGTCLSNSTSSVYIYDVYSYVSVKGDGG